MQDKFIELEEKVSALVAALGEQRRRLEALKKENAALGRQLKSAQEKIESLESEREGLARQLEDGVSKEDEMRERLRTIIARIDQVEAEIAENASAEEEEKAS